VADFIGECNWIAGTVVSIDKESAKVETEIGIFDVKSSSNFSTNSKALLGFRPESVQLEESQSGANSFKASIEQSNYLGELEEYQLIATTGFRFKAIEQNPLRVRSSEMPVWAHVRPHDLLLVSPG
jgi:ABC-type Fe3+/spermidine/putrescine transport system ATPase subunit